MDNLITAPWGGNAVRVKDTQGYNVDIQKSMINEEVGIMFVSGSKCVPLTSSNYNKLK